VKKVNLPVEESEVLKKKNSRYDNPEPAMRCYDTTRETMVEVSAKSDSCSSQQSVQEVPFESSSQVRHHE
jgi:catabolite regulation protein CreA